MVVIQKVVNTYINSAIYQNPWKRPPFRSYIWSCFHVLESWFEVVCYKVGLILLHRVNISLTQYEQFSYVLCMNETCVTYHASIDPWLPFEPPGDAHLYSGYQVKPTEPMASMCQCLLKKHKSNRGMSMTPVREWCSSGGGGITVSHI